MRSLVRFQLAPPPPARPSGVPSAAYRLAVRVPTALLTAIAAFTLALGATPAAARPLDVEQTDAEVFLEVDATPRQIAAVQRALDRDPTVKAFSYLDQDATYKEFSRIFADNRDLVETVPASSLPA